MTANVRRPSNVTRQSTGVLRSWTVKRQTSVSGWSNGQSCPAAVTAETFQPAGTRTRSVVSTTPRRPVVLPVTPSSGVPAGGLHFLDSLTKVRADSENLRVRLGHAADQHSAAVGRERAFEVAGGFTQRFLRPEVVDQKAVFGGTEQFRIRGRPSIG